MCISGVWHHEFHVFTSNTSICDIYVTLSLPWCNEAVTTRSPIKETFPVKLKSQIQYRIALAARNGCNENNEVTTAASAAHSEGREEARLRRASRLWNRNLLRLLIKKTEALKNWPPIWVKHSLGVAWERCFVRVVSKIAMHLFLYCQKIGSLSDKCLLKLDKINNITQATY